MNDTQKMISILGTLFSFPLIFIAVLIFTAHDPSVIPYFLYVLVVYTLLIISFYVWLILLYVKLRDKKSTGRLIHLCIISIFVFVDIMLVMMGGL